MAETYDSSRDSTHQWVREQDIVEQLLSRFTPGTRVIDVPVGTGRFLEAYARGGFSVVGVDASSSMLEKAGEKLSGRDPVLVEGSIFSLEFPEDSFDLGVCIRFMDWVEAEAFAIALSELARVCRHSVIVSIPTFTPFRALKPWYFRGFLRLLKQWKYRFYLWRTNNDAIVHSRKAVDGLFERLDLRVEERICVDDQSVRLWQLGTDRDIYLLHKQSQ